MPIQLSSPFQDCETALKLEPGFIKAHVRKGNALMGMKKYSEAQSAFYKALELDGNNSEALEGLAKCKQNMYSGMSAKERAESAMKDPEVQVRGKERMVWREGRF